MTAALRSLFIENTMVPPAWQCKSTLSTSLPSGTPADPANSFSLQVIKFRDNQNPPLPPQILETFTGLVIDRNSPSFVDTVIGAGSRYITATADSANLATAGAGISRGGLLPIGDGAALPRTGRGEWRRGSGWRRGNFWYKRKRRYAVHKSSRGSAGLLDQS